jgi:hypothetical protein
VELVASLAPWRYEPALLIGIALLFSVPVLLLRPFVPWAFVGVGVWSLVGVAVRVIGG